MAKIQPRMQSEERGDGLREKMIAVNRVTKVVKGGRVLTSASSLEKEVRAQLKHGSSKKAAEVVGQRIAAKAKEKGIESVAFDRGGFKYHGRIKALADAARANGLKF